MKISGMKINNYFSTKLNYDIFNIVINRILQFLHISCADPHYNGEYAHSSVQMDRVLQNSYKLRAMGSV